MTKKSMLIISDEIILGKKIVCIKADEGIKLIDYEKEMIVNNPSLSFLNIEVKELDNKKSLNYSCGSLWSLNDYLKDEKLTISERIKISEIIFKKFSLMKEYILDNRKLLFRSDKIYLDKSSLSVYMIYVPLNLEFDRKIEDELRELFEDIFSDAGRYKSQLSIIERKLITGLISRNNTLYRIERLFLEYEKLNSHENLEERLYGSKKKHENIKEDVLEEDSTKEESALEKEKKIKRITYASVIDENYDVFEGFSESDLEDEEDDDYIQYKEFKELQEYDKALNETRKIKSLLKIQVFIFIVLVGIAVVLDSDNKTGVIIILVIAIIFITIFNIVIDKNLNQGEECNEEI